MKDSIKLCLIVRDKKSNHLNMTKLIKNQTEIKFKKVEINSKLYESKDIFDIWEYAYEFNDISELDDAVSEFLNKIKSTVKLINKTVEENQLFLKLYIQSDYAQLQYSLSSESLKELAEMSIKLDFSILSWGGAEI